MQRHAKRDPLPEPSYSTEHKYSQMSHGQKYWTQREGEEEVSISNIIEVSCELTQSLIKFELELISDISLYETAELSSYNSQFGLFQIKIQ